MESDHDSWMHMILSALVSQVERVAAWWQLSGSSLQDLSIISVAILGLTFPFLPIFSIWHFVHVPVGVYWTKILFVLFKYHYYYSSEELCNLRMVVGEFVRVS